MISFLSASRVTFSLCWQETTTVWTLMGTHAPPSNMYSAVTWVLESGRAHHSVPSRRRSAIFLFIWCASCRVRGMHSGVSSLA